MSSQVLHFPLRGHAGKRDLARTGVKMHYRFEICRLADTIVGELPKVRILQIAWYEKREHVARFIRDYHAGHGILPQGRIDLGVTDDLRLTVGTVDFDLARQRLYRDPGQRRRFRPSLAGCVKWLKSGFSR